MVVGVDDVFEYELLFNWAAARASAAAFDPKPLEYASVVVLEDVVVP